MFRHADASAEEFMAIEVGDGIVFRTQVDLIDKSDTLDSSCLRIHGECIHGKGSAKCTPHVDVGID